MRSSPLLFAAWSLLTVASPLLAQQANDVILRKDGARIRGVELTEFSHTGLKATKGDKTIEIPGHLVVSVQWGNPPESMVTGRASMERGDFATATQLFGEAANQATRPLIKTDCEFFQFQAAVAAIGTDKGAAATAAGRAKSWLAANGTHWRVPEAMLLAGRAERLAGSATEATATLRDLDDRSTRDGFGPVWTARAKFELALTLIADGKGGEARTIFQSASSAADSALQTASPDNAELQTLKILAKIGEGETYLGEKQYPRAESYFHGLTTNDQPGLAAAAWAGEGQAVFLSAVEGKRPDEMRRAQVALAKAAVLDSESGEASAKANYFLGRCLLELGSDREGDSYKTRAKAYFQIVVTTYASSQWAAAAKAAMQS